MDIEIETVERTVAQYQRHQNDTEHFLALHTDETAVVNIAGRRVLGKEQFATAMTAALASPLARVRTTLDIEDIRFPHPDVALVSAIKTVHDERDDKDASDSSLPPTGALTLVMVRSDGAWKVALAQTTPRIAA